MTYAVRWLGTGKLNRGWPDDETVAAYHALDIARAMAGDEGRVEYHPDWVGRMPHQCAVVGCKEDTEELDRLEGKRYRYCERHAVVKGKEVLP